MRDTFLPFSLPLLAQEEIDEVADSLRSGWITTGPKTRRFEEDFGRYVGSSHAIAVNSCTAGLHIALTALDVGPGDEVIVPTLTFCSTANVVVHLGARPVLVDVDDDFSISLQAIEGAITPQTKVIMPVHYAGQACHLQEIYSLAASRGLAVVEDAAHAVGAVYHGYKIGSDALSSLLPIDMVNYTGPVRAATVFSFYATKNMTTGEGGMITTSENTLAEHMRLLSLHGMSHDAWKRYTSAGSWAYEVVAAGYKDNMTDIQAAMGIHQLRKLDGFITRRQQIARLYDEAFTDTPEIQTPTTAADRTHVYHLYVVRLNLDRLTIDRGRFIAELKARNIGASVHFIPVHLHPFYRKTFGYNYGDCPIAERLYERIVSLPIFPGMTDDDVCDVIEAVRTIIVQHKR